MKNLIKKSEIEMIRELELRGYRIYSRFRPFKAIVGSRWEPWGRRLYEAMIIGETPQFAWVKTEEREEKVPKELIYKPDPEVLRILDEARKKALELEKRADEVESEVEIIHRRAREIRGQADEIMSDAQKEIRQRLEPVYPVKETEVKVLTREDWRRAEEIVKGR